MRIYKIKVNGKTYEVKVMGITEVEPVEVKTVTGTVLKTEKKEEEKKPQQTPASGSGTVIPSPMQGTILDVKVKVGDSVKKGDTVCILEAMKLENEIKSTADGKVLEVKVTKGQSVNAKDTIVVLG